MRTELLGDLFEVRHEFASDRNANDLHGRISGSELVIYSDSGHGGIFQYHHQFAPVAVEFLTR